ncbi:MAG: Rrf2 family transcriptional regulator [Pirellulales bacterium]|nr:Rrf2 family transcriptional regulator [Pirellulales bacterium]
MSTSIFGKVEPFNMDVKVRFPWVSGFMFSQTVEYALRAVVYLADHAPSARTTEQIAESTLVPKAYLAKVIQSLCRRDVLKSKRGIGGGVSLVRTPKELTILEVVNAVEPIGRIRECPLGLKAHGVHLCPLHQRMDNALAMVEEAFEKTTLAEILAEPTKSRPLCEIPTKMEVSR